MKCRTIHHADGAFTLIEMFVVIATLVVVAMLFLSANSREGPRARRATCINNLKQIGLSFRTWSTDNDDKYPMSFLTNSNGTLEMAAGTNAFRAYQVMSNELNSTKVLVCPQDTRKPPRNSDFALLKNINISYFVGLDTDETMPAMLLAGDRNLETNGIAVGSGLLVITRTNGVGFSTKMHNRQGNVALADGSVLGVDIPGLQRLMTSSITNAVRLAIP